MDRREWAYKGAGIAGGLLLMAGNLYGPLCLLQLSALPALLFLSLRTFNPKAAALCGFYMGLAFSIPQMFALRMPLLVTVGLLIWFTGILTLLCLGCAFLVRQGVLLGSLAVGAFWALLDWASCTAVPIWGLAQSFARSWTAYPALIQFISLTGICGVPLVLGTLQGLTSHLLARPACRKRAASALTGILLGLGILNTGLFLQRPSGHLRVAAAGWVFDDSFSEVDPHSTDGFEKLFAEPARQAARQGAVLFTTGELGFCIADHNRQEWMERFGRLARECRLWLAVGYLNISEHKNRMFFMSPEGEIVEEYTKTYLTPMEPRWGGSGELKTVCIENIAVGGLICQDDNFPRLTRYYGRLKTPIVLSPTADWQTIRYPHLQAVRARAIEGQYGIVRGAACGISAVIDPKGRILAQMDHYKEGPGLLVADLPIVQTITLFSRFGFVPLLAVFGVILATAVWCGLNPSNKKGGQETASEKTQQRPLLFSGAPAAQQTELAE
ncbi:MAG TPA: nitrilase-related carbon-nitrogen hydrolase [Anaerohalosphaeraceae bacterium]|nr:nitrilase-related carbon-nitrogen hydrolase [Anaerohalosphaeraceae bacterium]HOL89482.1 nitrilase-related carbon-nitrogen hydrolase [Anaerohalosphaeraceae bacterium]HPP55264.1 nitrilase-related carbon-nitrogen hydrolase [Anaerohalosphaeraceae bacterium]